MGIPKFFRWLSERYPLCSQLLSEEHVPEFDNFYLDMNGVIHNCARPIASSGKPFTESEIYQAIFAYVESLFLKIQPKKVFFLAVDGVAPRAKVNQQRARRFRSAKEAQDEREKEAKKKKSAMARFSSSTVSSLDLRVGNDERFDSNCITPGTTFMSNLDKHMKYFIAKKISEGGAWSSVNVIFSGSDVPGEGEHKVMEYIRLNKAKPGYNPNTRHCLYGLDADLILLGLLSHDPHFALLREEVTFGRPAKEKSLSDTRFFLLHLCLMREYIELEFEDLLENKSMSLERIIDDFVLLMCLVGNDFLPHLPNFHLGEGVLDTLFLTYKTVLRNSGSHLLNNGLIDFKRLAVLLDGLSVIERKILAQLYPSYFSPDGEIIKVKSKISSIPDARKTLQTYESLLTFIENPTELGWTSAEALGKEQIKLLHDAAFLFHLLFDLDLNPDGTGTVYLEKDPQMYRLSYFVDSLNQFKNQLLSFKAKLRSGDENAPFEVLQRWKMQYYEEKFEITSPDEVSGILANYCQTLQWNMYYYYEGVVSWSWYYRYHYAPHISDLALFMKQFKVAPFELSSPLRPLEQLMAVLPPHSSKLVPEPLAWLMTSSSSPLKKYYPDSFTTDANGKKNSWEAIVLIPFIESTDLLREMKRIYPKLNAEAMARNKFGKTWQISFSPHARTIERPSQQLSDVESAHVSIEEYSLPVLEVSEKFIAALCEGALLGVYAMPGFPTLQTLPFDKIFDSGMGLECFGQPAKGPSIILAIKTLYSDLSESVKNAKILIGQRVWVNWPYLQEGLTENIWDNKFCYSLDATGAVTQRLLNATEQNTYQNQCATIERMHRKQKGILTGEVGVIVWVKMLMGMTMDQDFIRSKVYGDQAVPFALQTVVTNRLDSHGNELQDSRHVEGLVDDFKQLFPVKSVCVFVGSGINHGSIGTIEGLQGHKVNVSLSVSTEPWGLSGDTIKGLLRYDDFISLQALATATGISTLLVSKLTSSLCLFLKGQLIREANIGLSLKSDKKGQCAAGLVIRKDEKWYFSTAVKDALLHYRTKYPMVIARLEQYKSASSFDAERILGPDVTKEALLTTTGLIQKEIHSILGEPTLVPADCCFPSKQSLHKLIEYWDRLLHSLTFKAVKLNTEFSEIVVYQTALRKLEDIPQQPFVVGDAAIYLGTKQASFGSQHMVIAVCGSELWLLAKSPNASFSNLGGMIQESRLVCVPQSECLKVRNVLTTGSVFERSLDLQLVPRQPTVPHGSRATSFGRSISVNELFAAVSIGDKNDKSAVERKPAVKGLLRPNLSWTRKE